MPLTRLLYDSAHAQASLTLSFTTANSIQEPLFWCEELFMSGFISEIFHALWKAFYLTCAIEYPHLSSYIINKTIEFTNDKNESPKHIRHIISKLFAARRNCITLNHYAYHTHKEILNKSISVLRGKAPTWINDYDKKSHQVLRHIHRKNPEKALALIAHSDNIEFINAVNKACHEYLGSPITTQTITHDNIVIAKLHAFTTILRKKPHNIPENSPFTPFNTPPMCEFNPSKESLRNSLTGFDSNNIDLSIPEHFITPLKITQQTTWKILRTHRLFPHHHSCQILTSNTPPNFDNVRFNWLDLCIGCPLWDQRIKNNSAYIKENKVTFNNDDDFEDFHNKWDLEFDEQPLEIQQMSIIVN